MKLRSVMSGLAGALMLLVGGAPIGSAFANDGVVEINEQRALAGGVTSGDSAGYPVTIDEPGSYRLTSSLVVDDGDQTIVEITAHGVTLDLNGFVIGQESPAAAGTGIGIDARAARFVTIKNGSVVATGSDGIALGFFSVVHDVSVRQPFGDCISVVLAGIVRHSVVAVCGGDGVDAPFTSLVHDNYVRQASGFGLALGQDGGYVRNVLRQNNGGDPNPQVDQGALLGNNICGLSTVCP